MWPGSVFVAGSTTGPGRRAHDADVCQHPDKSEMIRANENPRQEHTEWGWKIGKR